MVLSSSSSSSSSSSLSSLSLQTSNEQEEKVEEEEGEEEDMVKTLMSTLMSSSPPEAPFNPTPFSATAKATTDAEAEGEASALGAADGGDDAAIIVDSGDPAGGDSGGSFSATRPRLVEPARIGETSSPPPPGSRSRVASFRPDRRPEGGRAAEWLDELDGMISVQLVGCFGEPFCTK